MKLIALNLVNFGSYVGSQTFYFPDGPGLFFMYGENQAEPRLEGNATGKSTVWKALTWLFYDKTPAGLKAGDVASWSVGKKASVTLTFARDNGLPEFITRTWAPNSWKWTDLFGEIHDLAKDASIISDVINLSYDAFLQSIVMPQGEPLFLELKAPEQAALFSSVMNLDRWIQYSERASQRARTEDLEVRRWEREVARIDGSLASSRIPEILEQKRAWEEARERRLATLEEEHTRLCASRKQLEQQLKEAQRETDAHQAAYERQQLRVDDATKEVDNIRERLRLAEDTWRALNAELTAARVALRRLDGQKECPLCHHEITDGTPGLQHLQNEAGNADKRADAAGREVDRLETEFKAWGRRLNEEVAQCELLATAAGNATAQERRLERDIAGLDQTLDRVEDDAEQLEKAESPFDALLKSSRSQEADLAAERKAAMRRLDEAQTRFSMASYWVRWFKDIRLAQIGEALTQLDLEVNNQVTALGLLDWSLEFDVDKLSKSGTVQRGFTTSVYSPNNNKVVPWDSWSGGEKQRLIVAGQMGLGDLIRSRTGCTFGLEVWDEPTKGMSPQGVQDLLEALRARAHREQRQIWVVDHNTLGFNKFDGSIKIIRDLESSKFAASTV